MQKSFSVIHRVRGFVGTVRAPTAYQAVTRGAGDDWERLGYYAKPSTEPNAYWVYKPNGERFRDPVRKVNTAKMAVRRKAAKSSRSMYWAKQVRSRPMTEHRVVAQALLF